MVAVRAPVSFAFRKTPGKDVVPIKNLIQVSLDWICRAETQPALLSCPT